ncbi:MAG: homoserine dehydrogenase [Lachnospiraceae bacterium]|jgi:homoserine dehydrogenase|nr:homoserine dehydrogenase [Lachnospiraceae bacterium]
MTNIAILGYGTVGSGVAAVIAKNQDRLVKQLGSGIAVKYILDIRDFPDDPNAGKIVRDLSQIVDDPEVAVVCETMGGVSYAYDFTKRALLAGKSVCTSNKELVASHGPELQSIAAEKKCHYLFEASVGGGIPIIRLLGSALSVERITGIAGILNGTTNYMLTKMEKEGADYAAVLKEAQDLGYAESNPEADVGGHDSARKIAILGSLMTGKNVNYEKVYTEGITQITAADFSCARLLGMTIKLLASAEVDESGSFYAYVAPFLLAAEHPLYPVNDVYNAVFVRSNMLGNSMYYGRGAGKLPTASAVVADVVRSINHLGQAFPCPWDASEMAVVPMEQRLSRFLVRIVRSSDENIRRARELFPGFSPLPMPDLVAGEYAFTCGPLPEAEFAEKVAKLPSGIVSRIRFT